jgi:hypothetical protein
MLTLRGRTCTLRENVLEYATVLDLIRLADDRWLVRAAATRRDGTVVSFEEVLVCEGVPDVELVVDLRGEHAYLVLRERHDPDHVLVERAIDNDPAPALRVVWDASQWDAARARPVNPAPGPIVPA